MHIDEVYLEPQSPLYRDMIHHFDRVADLYGYSPADEENMLLRAKRQRERESGIDRVRLAEVIREYHGSELSHPEVERNLKRLAQPDSLVVIGGQQAGLMTGPLYTIYKAITIIQLARREEKRLGRPVLPVFWIAGEDHDLDEVDHIYLFGGKGEPLKHRLKIHSEQKVPVSNVVPTPDMWEEWVQGLEQLLPDSEYKAGILSKLRQHANSRLSLSRHFARWMHEWFGRYGLLLIDAAFPPLRQLEVPFFERLIDHNQDLQHALVTQIEQVKEKGYPVQLDLPREHAHLFLLQNGERCALEQTGGRFRTREEEDSWTAEELKALLHRHPEWFSNNVVSRPLMQEFLFPVLAVVLGPGETAYWGLLKEAFALFDMEMPPLFPRISLTLMDRRWEKQLRRFQWSFQDVLLREEMKKREWLNSQIQWDVAARFDQVRARLREIYTPLVEELAQIRPDLKPLGETNHRKLLQQVDYLEKRAKKALEERFDTDVHRMNQLKNGLAPAGGLQERIYNLLPFWNRYGKEWIFRLIDTPLLSLANHRVVYL
ncbi:putative cysteine ligase BshC [Marinithermofilum abyssi]|uniref:Putative cysteine ligase BshC n=1 Tax=Marinithermofilum abyssi TaxID=1571185 RepID=A0A8J2VJ55_9BACL|nr:bacillithiol biosynthesis cysteine-adding enzyme BshC [Marinithermofilum abyssi]GGE22629.1 putative cysteine ligase BshC [Marinithermofilum abyssi]